jgi:hypothetical protein
MWKSRILPLVLWYVPCPPSLNTHGLTDISFTQADIIPGLSAKQPKTVAGSVFALKEVVR